MIVSLSSSVLTAINFAGDSHRYQAFLQELTKMLGPMDDVKAVAKLTSRFPAKRAFITGAASGLGRAWPSNSRARDGGLASSTFRSRA